MAGRTTHTTTFGSDTFELRTLGAGEGIEAQMLMSGMADPNPLNAVVAVREIRKLIVRDCVLITQEGDPPAPVRVPLSSVYDERYAGPDGQKIFEQVIKWFLEINFKVFSSAGKP